MYRKVESSDINIRKGTYKCRLMPCPSTGPKFFCAGPNFLSQPKNLTAFSASHKHFVPDKKMICIQQNWFLCRHKSFWKGTKCSQIFGLAQKIWTGTKNFGTCKRTRHKFHDDVITRENKISLLLKNIDENRQTFDKQQVS